MKKTTTTKYTNKEIELAIWQLLAIIIAAIACLFAIAPLISGYRSNKCDTIYIQNAIESSSPSSEISPNYHGRYVRDVGLRAQCDVIPPMCIATTTVASTSSLATTTRSTVSTVLVTRPMITTFSTTPRTTTPDPWTNLTRPYNSWRLPTFAKPIDYTLHIACPDCFTSTSNLSTIPFNGQVAIRINILNATDYLVLHAKNLNIIQANITSGTTSTATITYLPEFEMIYLFFGPSTIPLGEITLLIDYTGEINQQDQTGFYREIFRTSNGGFSYLLAANFQPIHARQAFPCFDEPAMQSTFTLTLDHPQNSTIALANTGVASQTDPQTVFATTQILSTYALAWAILPLDGFKSVTQAFGNTTVHIWTQSQSNTNFNQTFDIIGKTFQFVQDYLNISTEYFPIKLDFIGIPDLILDEKASSTWGLLTFREEFLNIDLTLNSAERLQTTTKIIVDYILQIWLSKIDWWDNAWFDKSLSSFLAYKMIEEYYPLFKLMEQFPLREMVPFMIDDFKPSIWPISNTNFTNNEQILDYLSPNIYSKGASLLRLLEYISGNETFQTAVQNILLINDSSNVLNIFYSNFETILNTTITVEEFLRSWLEERNYPIVTIDFISGNYTNPNTTLIFRQSRYMGSFELNLNSTWIIYMECDLGGSSEGDNWNLTANYFPSRIKILLDSSIETIQLNEEFLWIKCNKNFYSYQVTEYISDGEDQYALWRSFASLFNEDIFSNNDQANLLHDAFILPYGGEIVNYDQTLNLLRRLFTNPVENFVPWSVFIWHWNYLTGIEEHSKYFWNFKQFATRQILAPFSFNIDNIVTTGTDHQERLIKSMFFELLCRIQDPDALNKATELFRLIPLSYFSNSTGITNVGEDYLSTVIYYHLQNTNDVDEWDYLWMNLTENQDITAQQRSVFLLALGAAKEIWRLKTILENAFDINTNLIRTQEFFDLIISISENPNGRDILWNYYRQNYESFLTQFGQTNRLFNQLITNIVQSFENRYYYSQLTNFLNQYSPSFPTQQLALDQILININWLTNGMAEYLDDAIAAGDRLNSKK